MSFQQDVVVSTLFYILMGLVQGILEWLPVSSEGQLVVISLWVGETTVENAISLAFWLHLGTMIAVLVYYRTEWMKILDVRTGELTSERKLLIISTLGTAIVGVPIKILLIDAVDWTRWSNLFMLLIGISLLITGYLIQYSRNQTGIRTLDELTLRDFLMIGLAQGFTIIPGISRSGTTVSTFLLLKTEPNDSFRGSFLISVPAVLGAVTLDILGSVLDGESLVGDLDPTGILLAIPLAFLSGILTIKVLLDTVERYNFSIVAYVLGGFIIIISVVTLLI